MAWQRGVCRLFPSIPQAGTSDFPTFLTKTLIIFVVERCWLMAGLTEAVLEDAGDEMISLGALFYWLASLYYFHWPVHLFVSWYFVTSSESFTCSGTSLFQMKLNCSYIGNVVKLQLDDNVKYFPDLAWISISSSSLQCRHVLESLSLLLWKLF